MHPSELRYVINSYLQEHMYPEHSIHDMLTMDIPFLYINYDVGLRECNNGIPVVVINVSSHLISEAFLLILIGLLNININIPIVMHVHSTDRRFYLTLFDNMVIHGLANLAYIGYSNNSRRSKLYIQDILQVITNLNVPDYELFRKVLYRIKDNVIMEISDDMLMTESKSDSIYKDKYYIKDIVYRQIFIERMNNTIKEEDISL